MKHLNISLFSVPFSVNQISTLADFEDCERLQELYLRKNNIPDLSELAYIQVNKHAEINKNKRLNARTIFETILEFG